MGLSMELTVGYVSGIIALALIVAQLLIPTAITMLLIAVLSDRNNAVTWSVAGRAIQSSWWPSLLGADTTAHHGVRKQVLWVTYLTPLALALLALAGILTPMGLHEVIVPGPAMSKRFEHLKDPSPLGYGTPPRSDLGLSRRCGGETLTRCPGSDVVIIPSLDAGDRSVTLPNGYNTTIPRETIEWYSSGLSDENKTISNVFDIQWRQYSVVRDNGTNRGGDYLVGAFRPLDLLLLNDAVEAVDGLVVDTKVGGVGFRNHTAPTGLPYGATWSEDLLFIQPETQCVNTNLTLDFTLRSRSIWLEVGAVVLTDRGGFVNLAREQPKHEKGQSNPDLRGRAYGAAWKHNHLAMVIYNATSPSFAYLNSTIGQTYPLGPTNRASYRGVQVTDLWGQYFDFDNWRALGDNPPSSPWPLDDPGHLFPPPNPWGIGSVNFSEIDSLCQGDRRSDKANIDNILVGCGMMYGVARRSDGQNLLSSEPGSRWSVSLYSCASAVKASIKTVDFLFNGTSGLKGLKVVGTRDKVYDRSTLEPTWAVENLELPLEAVQPLWGLVAPGAKEARNTSTLRAKTLWLPGAINTTFSTAAFSQQYQNLPGVDFPPYAMGRAYSIGVPEFGETDYSGTSNLAMYIEWQECSNSSETAARILNLVWTDVAANAVTGTKGLSNLVGGKDMVSFPAQAYVRRVRYRAPFMIPAIVVIIFSVSISLAVLILWITGQFEISSMRRFLQHTSTGRILTMFLFPNECNKSSARTEDWIRRVGIKEIDLRPLGVGPEKRRHFTSNEDVDLRSYEVFYVFDPKSNTEVTGHMVDLYTP